MDAIDAPVNNAGTKDNSKDAEKKDGKDDKPGLKPLIIKGTRSRKKKDIQSISRQTMTAEDLKEVPASFGDSINALTALPGIIRTFGGIFGPLVIRGADPSTNRYFIDDIPVNDPLHFGGLHSVINTNLMSEIDVYSSAFPAEFGSATSAIINITTIDDVNEFGGYAELSLLSASTLIKTPILKDKFGRLILDSPSHPEIESETENAGYFIGSGRYGYIALGIKAAELITGDKSPVSPEYWDYQVKSKYKINSVNSVTMLLFGHKDFIRILIDDNLLEKGDDPLMTDTKLRSHKTTHSQGLYLDSKFTSDFSNRLLYYSSLPDTYSYMNFGSQGAASWAKDIHSHSRPWVFGLKDKAKLKWMDGHSELSGSAEYTLYYFTAKGRTIIPTGTIIVFDPGNEDAFRAYTLDEKIINHVYGGYIENKFTYSGLTVLPGIRSEYLARTETATFDPRLMASYKFPTDTAISAAAGQYSYFFQTNPYYFDNNPDISGIGSKKTKPEKARHLALGAEQEIGLFTLKLEGFNNYFYDKPVAYPHREPDGTYLQGLSTGRVKAHGFEIMLRKDSKENRDGLFGWLSYTYTRSRYKSGLPAEDGLYGLVDEGGNYINKAGDLFGDQYMTFQFEQRHCLKLIAGYKISNHTISGRFQYYSGFPYTPYIDSTEDPDYPGRHIPVTGERNSKNFPPYYQLDMRYTRKIDHSWGYVSWYVEVINVFSAKAVEYKWYWDKPYSEGSNPKLRSVQGFSFLPNFGVEVKF